MGGAAGVVADRVVRCADVAVGAVDAVATSCVEATSSAVLPDAAALPVRCWRGAA